MLSIFCKEKDRCEHAITGLFFSETDNVRKYCAARTPERYSTKNLLLTIPDLREIRVIGRGGRTGVTPVGLKAFDVPFSCQARRAARSHTLTGRDFFHSFWLAPARSIAKCASNFVDTRVNHRRIILTLEFLLIFAITAYFYANALTQLVESAFEMARSTF